MSNTKPYITGFVLSIALTLAAYFLVVGSVFPPRILIASIVALGVAQLAVQMIFFLHIRQEQKPRWNLVALAFTLLITAIVVGGSLWIMYHLDHNMTQMQFVNDEVSPQTQTIY